MGAVYHYYESGRQIINDSKPLRAEAVRANKQKKPENSSYKTGTSYQCWGR